MHPPIRVAHIGAGRFSRKAHGPALRRLADAVPPRVALCGIADLDEARPERARMFCRDFGYSASYRGISELIERAAPDVLVCVVEASQTAALVGDLLPLRIPLLLEKPPALSVSDAARLAELSIAHRTRHYVAFNRRRVPFLESARSWIRERGAPRRARAELRRQARCDANFAITTGIHAVDAMRYLAGDIVWMDAAQATGLVGRDYRAAVCFESGCRGDICLSMDSGATRETYLFEYDNCTRVEVTMAAPYSDPAVWAGLRVMRNDRVLHEEPSSADRLIATGITGEYEAFFAAIAEGRQPDCSLTDAWRSMLVAEGIERGYRGSLPHDPGSSHHADTAAFSSGS